MYTTFVRPHLEYNVQVWNSSAKNYVTTLEKVERKATKVQKQSLEATDLQRLQNLNLTILEVRQERGLIQL